MHLLEELNGVIRLPLAYIRDSSTVGVFELGIKTWSRIFVVSQLFDYFGFSFSGRVLQQNYSREHSAAILSIRIYLSIISFHVFAYTYVCSCPHKERGNPHFFRVFMGVRSEETAFSFLLSIPRLMDRLRQT